VATAAANSQLVEHRARNRRVVKLWFNSRSGSTSLFLILGLSSLPVVRAQPDKKHANKTDLCWSSRTDTQHNSSYEREKRKCTETCFVLEMSLRPYLFCTWNVLTSFVLKTSLLV